MGAVAPNQVAAATATLRVYRSNDATITTDDELVGTVTVSALAVSASNSASVVLNAPSSSGTHYYGACVDAAAEDSDNADNCSDPVEVTVPEAQDTAPASPWPDLVVESPAVSAATLAAGVDFTFSATVRNAGGGNAALALLYVYLSEDGTVATVDELELALSHEGADTTAELAPSASEVVTVDLVAPPGLGTYYYGSCVEPVADEADTSNNCSAPVPVTVTTLQPPPPNLELGSPSVYPGSPAIGGHLRLSATVRNAGGSTVWEPAVSFYRSEDATITTSDTKVGAFTLEPLPAGWSVDTGVSLGTPSSIGTYYYGVCADATDVCSAAVQVEVSHDKPNLVQVQFLYSWTARQAVKFVPAAINVGSDFEGTTWMRFYHSTDATITTSDTELGAFEVSPVCCWFDWIFDIFVVGFEVTLPSTPGTHYYGACVDVVPGESDTTDNCTPNPWSHTPTSDSADPPWLVSIDPLDSSVTEGESLHFDLKVAPESWHGPRVAFAVDYNQHGFASGSGR